MRLARPLTPAVQPTPVYCLSTQRAAYRRLTRAPSMRSPRVRGGTHTAHRTCTAPAQHVRTCLGTQARRRAGWRSATGRARAARARPTREWPSPEVRLPLARRQRQRQRQRQWRPESDAASRAAAPSAAGLLLAPPVAASLLHGGWRPARRLCLRARARRPRRVQAASAVDTSGLVLPLRKATRHSPARRWLQGRRPLRGTPQALPPHGSERDASPPPLDYTHQAVRRAEPSAHAARTSAPSQRRRRRRGGVDQPRGATGGLPTNFCQPAV